MPKKIKDPKAVQRRRQGDLGGISPDLVDKVIDLLGGKEEVRRQAQGNGEASGGLLRLVLTTSLDEDSPRRLVLLRRAPNIFDLLRKAKDVFMIDAARAFQVIDGDAGPQPIPLLETAGLQDDDLVLVRITLGLFRRSHPTNHWNVIFLTSTFWVEIFGRLIQNPRPRTFLEKRQAPQSLSRLAKARNNSSLSPCLGPHLRTIRGPDRKSL